VKIETGAETGNFYYTRDHLGSVRELTDSDGNVLARYSYDPFGRRTRLTGGLDADFGFAGMFWPVDVDLGLTRFRVYDPNIGRWLSRDPLKNAELEEGYNLFCYVRNDPLNAVDPLGLTVQPCYPLGWERRTDPKCLREAFEDYQICTIKATGLPPDEWDCELKKCDQAYRTAVDACPQICAPRPGSSG
jgi:RHS repeat-associated protein